MLHGSPTRPAHRASSGGLALLVRQTVQQTVASATGQRRTPPARRRAARVRPARRIPARPGPASTEGAYGRVRARRRPDAAFLLRCAVADVLALRHPPAGARQAPQRVMSGLAAVIVLSICGLIGYFIVADDRRVQDGAAAVTDVPPPPALDTRAADPRPLSLTEVFGESEIRLGEGNEPYRVAMTHIDSECDSATTGALGNALGAEDCSQVVRAELTAPYGGYRVTAGIFNLADAAGVARVGGQVRELVESGGGSFAAMSAGAAPGSSPRTVVDAQVGWHEYGHYLIYCVIAGPDGGPLEADDPYAGRITLDLLETYLAQQRLARRQTA